MPADECGECRAGTQPVTTDHFEIYEWIAQWNVDGTRQLNLLTDEWEFTSSTIQGQIIVGGEGYDEFINSQCLCMDMSTGQVTQSDILII